MNMVSVAEWQSQFKLIGDLWGAFLREQGSLFPKLTEDTDPRSSLEFILWCIEKGHLSEAPFVNWLSQKTNLPVVKRGFFDIPADLHFWERMKPLTAWSADCLPLGEWDGHLVVGTLWPHDSNQLDGLLERRLRYTVVLCPPSGLLLLSQKMGLYNQSSVASAPAPAAASLTPTSVDAPVGLSLPTIAPSTSDTKSPEGAGEDFFAKLQRGLSGDTSGADGALNETPNAEQPASSHDGAPEGLVLPDGLNLSGLDLNKLNSLADTPQAPPNDAPVASVASAKSENSGDDSSAVRLGPSDPDSAVRAANSRGSTEEGLSETAEDRSNIMIPNGTLVHNFETGGKQIVAKKTFSADGKLESRRIASDDSSIPASIPLPPPLALIETAEEAHVSDDNGMIPPPAPLPEGESIKVQSLEVEEKPTPTGEAKTGVKTGAAPGAARSATASGPEIPAPIPTTPPPIKSASQWVASQSEAPKTGPVLPPPPGPDVDPDATQPSFPLSNLKPTLGRSPNQTPAATGPTLDFKPSDELKAKPKVPPIPPPPSIKRPVTPGVKSRGNTGEAFKAHTIEAPPVTNFFGSSITRSNLGGAAVDVKTEEDIIKGKIIPIAKIEAKHLDESRTIDEAGAQALVQISNVFEVPMILLFRDGLLLPWKWSDLFLSVKGDKPDPIDLEEPSMFKIVFRTAKPYHGYVVTSIVNQKFFNEFYRGMLPKHATIVPIMIEGRMAGMVLGFTNGKIDYRQSLRLMERMAFDLGRVFTSLRGTMSKSA